MPSLGCYRRYVKTKLLYGNSVLPSLHCRSKVIRYESRYMILSCCCVYGKQKSRPYFHFIRGYKVGFFTRSCGNRMLDVRQTEYAIGGYGIVDAVDSLFSPSRARNIKQSPKFKVGELSSSHFGISAFHLLYFRCFSIRICWQATSKVKQCFHQIDACHQINNFHSLNIKT